MHILFDYNFSPLSPVDASYIFPATFRSDENFIMKQIKADQLCDAREIKKKKKKIGFSISSVLSTGTLKSVFTLWIYIYIYIQTHERECDANF